MLIEWNENQRDIFARRWPCCDIPATGWAVFESNGDLVDISDNTRNCEQGGGMVEFLSDLQGIK